MANRTKVYCRLNRRPSKTRCSRSRALSMVGSNHVSKGRRAHSLFAGLKKLSVFSPGHVYTRLRALSFVYLIYRAMSDKRVEYKAGFGTKARSWHRCIKVARTKLDKRLKCDAESDACDSDPAATLKSIFSANKFWPTVVAPFCLSGILVEKCFWNFQIFIITINITPHVITQQSW